jgi:imidazolonepropionase-like amidohydrolase
MGNVQDQAGNRTGPRAAAAGALTVEAGWLIDGSGRPAQPGVRLEIEGGRIRALGTRRPAEGAGAGSGCVDLSGCTILPGLVDGHVHLCLSGTLDPQRRLRQLRAGRAELAAAVAAHLRRHFAAGVLAVRDGGDRGGIARRFRCGPDARAAGLPPVAVSSGGPAWHRPGRYGSLIGRALPAGRSLAELAANVKRVDFLKVVQSGLNSLTVYGRQTAPQFDAVEIAAACAAARRRGLGLMVHANGREPVRAAVEAGCLSIEHGFFMGRENLERMAARGVFWVPTAVTMHAYAEALAAAGQPADVARRTLEHQLEQLRLARAIGVAVAAGTDAGSPGVAHGPALGVELRLFMQAGFRVEEAVACASRNGARLLGLDGGELAAGRTASFIAVPGPPDGLPESLARLRAVVVAGRWAPWPPCGEPGPPPGDGSGRTADREAAA